MRTIASSPQLASPTGASIPAATLVAPAPGCVALEDPHPEAAASGAPGTGEADRPAAHDHRIQVVPSAVMGAQTAQGNHDVPVATAGAAGFLAHDGLSASFAGLEGDPRHHPCAGITRIRFRRSAAELPPSQPVYGAPVVNPWYPRLACGIPHGDGRPARVRDSCAWPDHAMSVFADSGMRAFTSSARACRTVGTRPRCSRRRFAAGQTSSSSARRPRAARRSWCPSPSHSGGRPPRTAPCSS